MIHSYIIVNQILWVLELIQFGTLSLRKIIQNYEYKNYIKINIHKGKINHNKLLVPRRFESFPSEIRQFTRNADKEKLPDYNLPSPSHQQ